MKPSSRFKGLNPKDYSAKPCLQCRGTGKSGPWRCGECQGTGKQPTRATLTQRKKDLRTTVSAEKRKYAGKESCPECGAWEDEGWSIDHCDVCGYEPANEGTMKKALKLSRTQLRNIIKEAIQHKPLGEAEMPYRTTRGISPGADDLLDEIGNLVEKHFNRDGYNPDDPSMANVGPQAWQEQVDLAVGEFIRIAEEALETIDQKLTDGEYYH